MKQEPLGEACSRPGARSSAATDRGIWDGSASGHRIHCAAMAVARPPVVSQAEWDTALAAMTEREAAVAAAMHELAAARKRMPMVRVDHDYRFEGPDGRRSLLELFDGRSQLILYRFFFEEGVARLARRRLRRLLVRSPTASPSSASCTPATSPSRWHRRRHRRTCARYAERMGWTDVPWYTICTERFSADFGVDEWFGLNVFLRDGDDVYRTYFLQHGRDGPADRQHLERCSTSRPTAGSPTTRTRPRAGRRRRIRSGSAVTTSSTNRRRRPTLASRPSDAGRSARKRGWRRARPE